MSGFSAEWLKLREPYDMLARDPSIVDAIGAAFRGQSAISIVDLACGTGATLRALSPRLPMRQNWRLADNDLSLLGIAAGLGRPPEVNVAARAIDLARDLELALDGPIDLVTTSALLDLVSQEWLERLVTEAAARRLPVYAALSYDGRIEFDPGSPFDDKIVRAVNRHQHRDKGFGPALGPDAVRQAGQVFNRVGYSFVEAPADWMFGPRDKAIQSEVLHGFAHAALELGDLPDDAVAEWLERRLGDVARGNAAMRVGHVDFFAMPMPMR
jgi:hypothetical protein